MSENARQAAFSALMKIEKSGAYSNLSLDAQLKNADFSAEDRALVSALIYGVAERKLTLDFNIERCLTQPLKKLRINVLTCLRLGALQILFMDRIPDSAAVNEAVKLSKTNGFSYASGLINAVLRKISAKGLILPEKDSVSRFLSVSYSCSEEIVDLLLEQYDQGTVEGLLSASLEPPKLFVRANTTKTTASRLKILLENEGVDAGDASTDSSLVLSMNGRSIGVLKTFKSGLFHVQDLSSQLCAAAVGALPGETVFDVCAAPGGKSFTIAEIMEDRGSVHAFDIHPHRVRLIEDGARRLGLSAVKAEVSDARRFDPSRGSADRVLCDVPCSGLGTIAGKPDIKYKSSGEIDSLPPLQLEILEASSRYVRDGGRLVYSTCTVNKKENEAVVSCFLLGHPEFSPAPLFEDGDETERTFFPQNDGCGGFFIAAFMKQNGK